MRRATRTLLAAMSAAIVLSSPALAAPPNLATWHRLNPDPANVAPEHERLQCLPGVEWVCRYDKLREPGYHWDRTIGMFHGTDVTADWSCPEWFDGAVCAGTEQVIGGVMAFNTRLRAGQELILTDGDGIAPLYVHWTDFGFACPWYGSFLDALAANPGQALDCMTP